MNDQQEHVSVDTTRHENSSGITADDVGLLAAFTQTVTKELRTVDHRNVGSNSNIKALQLDQKKILQGVDQPAVDTQPNITPVQSVESSAKEPVERTPTQESKPLPQVIQPTKALDQFELIDLQKRVTKIENSLNTIKKARRIKRNARYTVSSNSFKGVIKDAELLAEYVVSEVAKGVKTITIKIDDCKD